MIKLKWLFFAFLLGWPTVGSARTLVQGSFIELAGSEARIGINYPRHGLGEICGIELKTDVLVMHERVWSELSRHIVVLVEYDEDGLGDPVDPVIRKESTPSLSYELSHIGAAYAQLTITALGFDGLEAVWTSVLGGGKKVPRVIAVARSCGS